MLKVVVLNAGSVHPVLRTLAIAEHCTVTHFVEFGKRNKNHDLLEAAGISVEVFPVSERGSLGRVQEYLSRLIADAYVCHYASGIHVNACVLSRRFPLVMVAMGNDILYDEGDITLSSLEKFVVREGVRHATLISAKSRTLSDRLQQWRVAGTIDVNYWGVDPDTFFPGERTGAREALGLPTEREIILSPRAFEPRCNIHLVAQAFVQLATRRKDADIVFIGNKSDQQYAKRIEEQLSVAGLSGRARFVYGVGVREVIQYYRAASVAVSVASSEGFPNSVLEMLACRTPLVVGRIPQVEELMSDKDTAVLCRLNGDDIATKIAWVLDRQNSAAVDSITERGREVVLEHGDIRRNAERFVRLVERVAGTRGSRSPFLLWLALALLALQRRVRFAGG